MGKEAVTGYSSMSHHAGISRAPPRSPSAFQVGVICALPLEAARVIEFFDYTWDEADSLGMYPRSHTDNNIYTTGKIGAHNVVLVYLPSMGKTSAASVATELRASFPAIQLALVVGVCGAVPFNKDRKEIVLGDVIIGNDVVQYDFGRQFPSSFRMKEDRRESLGRSNTRIRSLFNKLMTPTYTLMIQNTATQTLELLNRSPATTPATYPGVTEDRLFQSTYRHLHNAKMRCVKCANGEDCEVAQKATCDDLKCDMRKLVYRSRLDTSKAKRHPTPMVHFGTFASADRVMKSGEHRDHVSSKYDAIGFEMEGAGVWESLPCVLIKGVCDYADSHKNKAWQDYSAATAAAYMKAFLHQWPHSVERVSASPEGPGITSPARDLIQDRQDRILKSLPVVHQAAFNHIEQSHHPVCLPQTRTNIIHRILRWAKSNDPHVLFWLHGMAGMGKSTISRTVARILENENLLAGSFFFSLGGGDRANGRKLVTTIAFQLAQVPIDGLKDQICNAIQNHPDIADKGMMDQWNKLIVEPLRLVNASIHSRPLVLIIDALDECLGEDVEQFISIVAGVRSRIANLRVLVSSRREPSVQQEISQIPSSERQEFSLQEVARKEVDADIKRYVTRDLKNANIPISEEEVTLLVEKASGLFLWASTACGFAKKGKYQARSRIQHVLRGSPSAMGPEKELDHIYTTILLSLASDTYTSFELHELHARLRYVLGGIVALLKPLPCDEFCLLLGMTYSELQETLQGLQSIIEVPQDSSEPVHLIHPSFRDFLCAPERCKIEALVVDPVEEHRAIAHQCVRSLNLVLRRDICYLQRPGILISEVNQRSIQESLPPSTQYACLYWHRHLQIAGLRDHDLPFIQSFLAQHALHWLEALSLISKFSECHLAISFLQSCIRNERDPVFFSFLSDMRRFILYHGKMIAEAPLQLYCSGLIFSPESSIMKKHFNNHIPAWISHYSKSQMDWSPCEQILEAHRKAVSTVDFSSTGAILLSGSQDCTVNVWDAMTGQLKHTITDGGCITSVAVSKDQILIAFASMVGSVVISSPCASKMRKLSGITGWATSISFSHDSSLLAAGLQDNSVVIWHLQSGKICFTSRAHVAPVTCVAFSPTQYVLASASKDRRISLWDIHSSKSNQMLVGHSGEVTSVSFSPDGMQLVSGSEDCTLRVWNLRKGTCRSLPKYHSSAVTCVAFGPDGRHVVSGSEDHSVIVWDILECQLKHVFRLHSDWVYGVSFAPDGRKVVSCSYDTTVRIWDITRSSQSHSAGQQLATVTAAALSHDGNMVVSGLSDGGLQLWESRTVRAVQYLKSHLGSISAAMFDHHENKIISGSSDTSVRIWNLDTGEVQALNGHNATIRGLACLADGSIASRSDDGTIRTWDRWTGMQINMFEDRTNSPQADIFQSNVAGPWTVDRSGRWIVYGGQRLLYLPVDLRQGGYASSADRIVIGGAHGQIISIGLDSLSCIAI